MNTVILFYWLPDSSIEGWNRYGHIALEFGDGEGKAIYASVYPDSGCRLLGTRAVFWRRFQEKPPAETLYLEGLDVRRMYQLWNSWKKSLYWWRWYHPFFMNCATVVLRLLVMGLSKKPNKNHLLIQATRNIWLWEWIILTTLPWNYWGPMPLIILPEHVWKIGCNLAPLIKSSNPQ